MLGATASAGWGLSGCAPMRTAASPAVAGELATTWSGRLSMRIDTQPPQTFAALFDLRGTPDTGELRLSTPIGSTLAGLNWAPGEALLRNGSETRRFDSLDALVAAATGAAIPVRSLFAWLAGRDEPVEGWSVDLRQHGSGRILAVRRQPQPPVDLRVVFEQP
ncbi:MAG: hypothetical protein EOO24_01370 [Comamonadaceae bacterium]|nr:MAG: hypothetical protein EOO24_01370 [Comamonadaceae bacterium]